MSNTLMGTGQSDDLTGTDDTSQIVGLAGDDSITGSGGEDMIVGDFDNANLLEDVGSIKTFESYAEKDGWTHVELADGHQEIEQTVETKDGVDYTFSLASAANYAGGEYTASVEVLWNGVVVATIDSNSALYEKSSVVVTGTSNNDVLTLRTVEPTLAVSPELNTDGPIVSYDKTVDINGTSVEVEAVAAGQAGMYQVLNGTLHVYDAETATYTKAGSNATVTVNSLGFNTEDDLFYAIAVSNGTDALGNAVANSDIVMLDANGDMYRIGENPYRSWTGDFDDKGNLWAFHSSMDRIAVIDVDSFDANGNPETTVFKFPKAMVNMKVWDVAFDAETQTFSGVVRPNSEGGVAQLMTIDVSKVQDGGQPEFTFTDVTGTMIDGVLQTGVPAITFGASFVDSDGFLYVGGNGGDHDMDDATASSGGIYRVMTDPSTGEVYLELLGDAPKSYSNDGAADPRGGSVFEKPETSAGLLITDMEIVEAADDANTYDDNIHAGGGKDEAYGGFGEDEIIGSSLGDTINGGDDNDALYGGAGPNYFSSIISWYDADGNRFDQYGNALPEDDDYLEGGAGDDLIDGSAGHDVLIGDAGEDSLDGGSGHDTLVGGTDNDEIYGGGHDDFGYGSQGADALYGGSGNDNLYGGSDADMLKGGSGSDTLDGGTGNDTLDGGSGNDSISGGYGEDYIKGGSGNDEIDGGIGKDYINGGSGADTISGGEDRDRIYLGAGDDVAYGGEGSDKFIFRNEDLDGSTDRIMDFENANGSGDELDFTNLNLLANGQTTADWVTTNVSTNADGNVVVNLNGTSLIIEDHLNVGSNLQSHVTDAFIFA